MLYAEDLDERGMMSHLPEGSAWDETVCRRGWKWWRGKEGGGEHALPETPKGSCLPHVLSWKHVVFDAKTRQLLAYNGN